MKRIDDNGVLVGMKSGRAFTLIELLVVIAIIGILAALLFPALTRAKQRAQGVLCLNGGKQMMVAMTIYGSDNNDLFPPNPDDANTMAGYNWCGGDASTNGADQFNPDILKDPARSLLTSYLSGNTSLFHCPGDQRYGTYTGSDPTLQGRQIIAARTFSMNQAVGTIDPEFDEYGGDPSNPTHHSGKPTMSVNGPWLDNSHTHHRNSPWLTYGKFSTLTAPGPSMTWVLVDEDARGINDAAFAFGMEYAYWVDLPGTYHNSGAGFSFADGHTEAHRWKMSGHKEHGAITNPADREDWLWMRQRTSADSTGMMPPPS